MKNMPIQNGVFLHAIPWALLEDHEAQALENHCGQSLQKLAERQGLSTCEALAIIEDRPWERLGRLAAELRLMNYITICSLVVEITEQE